MPLFLLFLQLTWQDHNRLGEEAFKAGKITESIREFDAAIKIEPRLAPQHWQRGISLYYAKRYDDCAKQFALHKTVNPEDVENAVFHYLCVARAQDVITARKGLIEIHNDDRVPMMQVYAMYQGKLKPEDVLKVAKSNESLFYAHLYIGLWYDAAGDTKNAVKHIKTAAGYPVGHYMHDVARIHLMPGLR
jgi:lipoprotein NlpI